MQGESLRAAHDSARSFLDKLGYDTTGLSTREIAELGRLAAGLEDAVETLRLAEREREISQKPKLLLLLFMPPTRFIRTERATNLLPMFVLSM